MTSLFGHAAEMADSLGLHEESAHWHTLKASMPQLDTDEENVLTIAKGHPYRQSHRHFSHAMAIFPLGILDVAQGAEDAEIVKSTIKRLTDVGPDWWCGYSYSWLGNLQARALNGDGAADALRIFAECFVCQTLFMSMATRPIRVSQNLLIGLSLSKVILPLQPGFRRCFCKATEI